MKSGDREPLDVGGMGKGMRGRWRRERRKRK